MNSILLPSQPGTYALILMASSAQKIKIGRLGWLSLNEGYYVYVGSAFGPGGLRARIHHHLRPARDPHWHIDYLRKAIQPVDVWYLANPRRSEHEWANFFFEMTQSHSSRTDISSRKGNLNHGTRPHGGTSPGARINVPLPRFGASDCRCKTHLFFFENSPSLEDFRNKVRTIIPNHALMRHTKACL